MAEQEQKQMTHSKCAWCGHVVAQESPRKFLGGYKVAPYPEDWRPVDGEWICNICKLEYLKAVAELKKRIKEKHPK